MNDSCAPASGSAKTIIGTKTDSSRVISLTEKAAEKLKAFMVSENKVGYGLRIAILPGGCSGFQTSLTFEKEGLTSDIKLEEHGVKIFVDKMSEPMIQGSVIDYVESLQGAGFTVINPNAKSACGCGASSSY